MDSIGLLPTYFCALIVFIPIVVVGISGTRARIRYVSFTNELRRTGKYAEWARANRILLLLENFSLYAFLTSFLGFMLAGVIKMEGVARFLFICFIITCALAVTLSFILYRKVPKE